MSARYQGRDLVIVVPTMNRPEKLGNLLESVAGQTEPVGRVIIIDGAVNAEPVAEAFSSRVSIEYLQCHPPGQIRQRNLGIAHVRPEESLVALLDDDIVLLPDSVEKMIAFWNAASDHPAAVCFNIVNGEPESHSRLRAALGLTASDPGRVLRSGMTTPASHLSADARIQWAPGGATVWRRDVLQERKHDEIRARWAIAEDLIFSYGVGKQQPLYVCAAAQCRHEHVFDYGVQKRQRYHGRTQTLWWYYFVASHRDLSRSRFFWTLLVRMAGKLGRGVVRRDPGSIEFVSGQASAALSILRTQLSGGELRALLEEA